MKGFLKKLTTASIVVSIGYGLYKVMRIIADEICKAEEESLEECVEEEKKRRKTKPTNRRKTRKKR